VPDSLADGHYLARGNIVEMQHPAAGLIRTLANPVRLADTPAEYRLPPPRLGEHTEAVLRELGFSQEEMDRLRQAGDI
jgi:formyl-CoA transferase/CoA:oxalate CoA-transferase